jgi:hypothetical protein
MTLRDFRISAGLSLAEVAAEVSQITGRTYTWTASREWEMRGTNKASVLDALQSLYGKTREEIIVASEGSRQKRYQPLRPGRPRKVAEA